MDELTQVFDEIFAEIEPMIHSEENMVERGNIVGVEKDSFYYGYHCGKADALIRIHKKIREIQWKNIPDEPVEG